MKTKRIPILVFALNLFVVFNTLAGNTHSGTESTVISYTTNYANNMSEIWNITSSDLTKPLLITYNIGTQVNCDYLTIYAVDNNGNVTSQLLRTSGVQSGTVSTTIPNGRVQVVFTTDGSVCYTGSNTACWGINVSFAINNNNLINNNLQVFGNGVFTESVGINTVTPVARLHNNSGPNNIYAAILATSTEGNNLVINSKNSNLINTEVFRLEHEFFNSSTARNNGFISFYRGSDTGKGFLAFGSNGTERMRIDAVGNVGIGTTTPGATLDIEKNADYQLRLGNGSGAWYNIGRNGTTGFLTFSGNQSAAYTGYTFGGVSGTYMTIKNGGNVGIGIDNPQGILHVKGGYENSWAYFSSNAGITSTKYNPKLNYGLAFTWNYSGGNGESIINYGSGLGDNTRLDFTSFDGTNLTTEMTLKKGKLGIGTSVPVEKLTIAGGHQDTKIRLYSTGNGSDMAANLSLWASEPGWTYCGTGIGYNVNGSPNYGRIDNTRGSSYMRFLPGETKFQFQTASGTDIDAITIKESGKVGIGISNITTDALLTVNGIIHAKEVKVSLDGLADYVFAPSYNLMPLTEVEQFVKINKHLPSIPSANEVKEDGLNMGEMQNKLLQKIEELTLYLIEQQKTIANQQGQIDELKRQIKK